MAYLHAKLMDKILDMVITAAIGGLAPYVTSWCWDQAGVQEMHRKFEGLLFWAERVNPTAQQLNTANLQQVQQLVRELQNEAQQGKELLDGQPTPANLSNAKERIERILVIAFELNELLSQGRILRNAREAGVHPKIKQPQFKVFKPNYLHRQTRFQVIRGYK